MIVLSSASLNVFEYLPINEPGFPELITDILYKLDLISIIRWPDMWTKGVRTIDCILGCIKKVGLVSVNPEQDRRIKAQAEANVKVLSFASENCIYLTN